MPKPEKKNHDGGDCGHSDNKPAESEPLKSTEEPSHQVFTRREYRANRQRGRKNYANSDIGGHGRSFLQVPNQKRTKKKRHGGADEGIDFQKKRQVQSRQTDVRDHVTS